MAMTLDEIYETFFWIPGETNEEYYLRVDDAINEAKKYKYLYPFIQPYIPNKSKGVWEPCAKVIAFKSDEELEPYLNKLFEWLQDMNWPGADIIYDRLLQIPFSLIEDAYNFSCSRAERNNDNPWLTALKDFKKDVDNINQNN